MASVKIKRVEIETKKEKQYNSIREAARENGCSATTLRGYIKSEREYNGYYWMNVGKRMGEWETWMIDYLKTNYSGVQSIQSIANKVGKSEDQVKNKVKYLGLKVNTDDEGDYKVIDYRQYKERVESAKGRVHKGSKVKVEYYAEALEENCNKIMKVVEAIVDGAYPYFINVIINGIRVSYAYEEVLEVLEG